MAILNRIDDFHGQPAVQLRTPAGDRATVLLHGAQVVSWIPAGGAERLYLSERSAYGDGTTVRGGVPVVFPQFNQRGPDFSLPKHGFVRTRPWQVQEGAARARPTDAAAVELLLVDDAETQALWPHRFRLSLTVSLGSHRLDLALRAANTGAAAFAFTAALHTYLRVADIEQARVRGLQGVRYLDTVRNLGSVGAGADLAFQAETDRIYMEVPGALSLLLPDGGLDIGMEGFRDVVVWNPWSDLCARLPDMPDEDYRRMLCIEAAAIDKPIRLDAGSAWLGRQTLTAR